MDRDIEPARQDDDQTAFRWESREVARRRVLEKTGVLDAIMHPAHGHLASLRNTLIICLVALAAVTSMVAVGMLRKDANVDEMAETLTVADTASGASEAVVGGADTPTSEVLSVTDLESEASQVNEEPNRADCQLIRGTAYESEVERTWFLDACVSEPEPAAFLAAPGTSRLDPEPAPQPAPVEGLSASDAIASAAGWIASQPDAAYVVANDDCSTAGLGDTWLVTCRATLLGCDFEKCASWHVVCVRDANRAVLDVRKC